MFRRRNQDTLPTAAYSAYGGGNPRGVADGSGRGIHMEAPIRRAWRNASGFTKGSYYAVLFNIFLVVWGIHELRRSNASIWLTCHAVQCTLQISPRGFQTTQFTFSRKQLIKSEMIKVDKDHNFVRLDGGAQPQHHYKADARKQHRKYINGPDIDGNYNSYTVVLRPPIVNEDLEDETGQYEADLSPLDEFTYQEEGTNNRIMPMRKFNLGQTKRRTRTMTSKIDSYIKLKRHQLAIKENAAVSWQGILALVFGLFMFLLTILVGQFYEEPTKTGGPGARRRTPQPTTTTRRAPNTTRKPVERMNRANIGKFH